MKHQAAKRWVAAVNQWSQLGEWDFLVCREPQLLDKDFTDLIRARKAHARERATHIHAQAEAEAKRLRSLGWEQADFARALRTGGVLGIKDG